MQGSQWRRWGGYEVASSYLMSCDREYFAVRNSAALFDVSPLAKYRISGAEAFDYLQNLVTRDLSGLRRHQVLYTPWCDHRGKVVDDGTLADLGEGVYQLTAAEQSLAWLERAATGYQVEIENITENYGVLALQGPTSLGILEELVGGGVADLEFSCSGTFLAEGLRLWISRTGYTGDLGYEIWVSAGEAEDLWDRLERIGQRYAMVAAGIWALDIARIEAGLIMLEVDYASALSVTQSGQASSPFELGLGWAVHFKKEGFIGRQALLQEKERGTTPYRFGGLILDEVAYRQAHEEFGLPPCLPIQAWRGVHPLFDAEGRQRGYATCGTWSPTLQQYLLLVQVDPELAVPGDSLEFEVVVDRKRCRIPGQLTRVPFFTTPRKKEMYVRV